MRWKGSVAIVTGASRGIGAAVARAAAARGARVGLIARNRDELDTVLASCGGDGVVAAADVSDRSRIEAAIAAITSTLGPVDVLVNNAGAGAYGSFASTDVDVFERMMRVNYLGTLYGMKAVLPSMIERRCGHIVNVASIAGRIGAPMESAYSASKFAVVGLSEAAGIEAAKHGVRVSLVDPGPVATEFFATRGHPYARKSPKPVSAERVASAVIAAVEREREEQFVPGWLRAATIFRLAAPPLYRIGASKGIEP